MGDFPGWIQCLVFSFSALTLSVRYKRDIQHRQHVKTGITASHISKGSRQEQMKKLRGIQLTHDNLEIDS